MQDKVDSKSQGFSASYGIGLGEHAVKQGNNVGVKDGIYTSSIGLGYNQGSVEQKITTRPSSFIAGAGELEVGQKVKQVGSLIDGGFTLNTKEYEVENVKDVNKAENFGINLTIYPGVSQIYEHGRPTAETVAGIAIGTQLQYGSKDYEAINQTTIGKNVKVLIEGKEADLSGINRDAENMVKVTKDRTVEQIDIDLSSEYWGTSYGREKFKGELAAVTFKVEILKDFFGLDKSKLEKVLEKEKQGKVLTEEEKQIKEEYETISFYLKEDYKVGNTEEIDQMLEEKIEDINKKLKEEEKLYTVENGKKVLNLDNIKNYMSALKNESSIKLEEQEETIASIFHMVNKEIPQNGEYVEFQDKWVKNALIAIYKKDYNKKSESGELYNGTLQKIIARDLRNSDVSQDIRNDIFVMINEITTDSFNKTLYTNGKNTLFEILLDNPKNFIETIYMDKYGRMKNPNLEFKNQEAIASYALSTHTIYMGENVGFTKLGAYFHEFNHGVQTFMILNRYSLQYIVGIRSGIMEQMDWMSLNMPIGSDYGIYLKGLAYDYSLLEVGSGAIFGVDSGSGKIYARSTIEVELKSQK